jgi:hypothetical protein
MPKRESERDRGVFYARIGPKLKRELDAELVRLGMTRKEALITFAESFIASAQIRRREFTPCEKKTPPRSSL